MIDTIVLRIHNLDKYPKIYEQYYNPSQKKNSFTHAIIDEETAELVEKHFQPAVIFHDSNRILLPNHRNSLFVPSSHYDLSYACNAQKNYLEFNFSIPKYLYSTNVLQFVNEYDQTAKTQFSILITFLHKFIKENFTTPPLLEDIEINRIDLCYNQFFNSKSDALAYLDEQKKLLVTKARSSKNNYRSYDTSLLYVTKRYSFKIYHKGTEFEAHDAKKLAKKNPKNLDLPYFQKQADTVLRYELTFRSSQINYLVKHYFFISEKKAMYPQYSNHIVTKTFERFIKTGYGKIYENYNRTGKFFTMKSVFDLTNNLLPVLIDHNNSKGRLEKRDFNINDTITFDATVFEIIYTTFWNKVKEYQLQQVMNVTDLSKKIDDYNSDVKTRKKLKNNKEDRSLDKTRTLILGLLVQCNYNIDELKKVIPERSFYRIKNELKQLGITSTHSNLHMSPPKLDYQDYRIFFGKYIRY